MYISFSRIVIVVLLASLYACLEGYLFLRALGRDVTKNRGWRILPWVYWPLSLLAAGLYFYFCYSSDGLRSLFSLTSSYWGLFLFIPFFVLADVLSFAGRFTGRFVGRFTGLIFRGLRNPLLARTVSLVLAGTTLALGSFSARYAKVTDYSVTVEKPLPQNSLKVVLISDIHIGAMVHKKQLARIVSRINALEGDMILIAGDIIDRNLTVYKDENLNEELRTLNAPMGVYAVMGNHDYFGGNSDELRKHLAAAGVRLLVDETVLADGVYVIGRNDFSAGRRGVIRKSLRELTENLDPSLPLIVIDHQPMSLGEAEEAGADLQVSGHTHRGQIWPGPIFTRRIYEHDYGLYYRGKTAFVVTSGCGTWGPPIRIGTRAEIVCIELKNP